MLYECPWCDTKISKNESEAIPVQSTGACVNTYITYGKPRNRDG